MPLSYTPRKFITHPGNNYFYLIEGDHRVLGPDAAEKRLDDLVRDNQRFNLALATHTPLINSADRARTLMMKL